MLKIEVKDGEKIERALKRYKRKVRNVKLHDQLRNNRYFTKPSVERRKQLEKAAYKEQYLNELEND
ncbi:30S ribosomal protein S21 [Croceivirga radicis]|uniref:30S ribosomal protein S21 n=1 Tax=Croceivirga radicis TaxID=1929488 RepID=UPI000255ADB6|nr:30S ribosomal protein S21 [Croceivirga radicis]